MRSSIFLLLSSLINRAALRSSPDRQGRAAVPWSANAMSHTHGTLGAMLGLAVGDALGAQVEFADPHRARELVASGLKMADSPSWAAGEWTDDTALALELAESIGQRGLLDPDDLACRYIRWAIDDGRGIGRATRAALVGASGAAEARRRAADFHVSTGMGASNGTVMRCALIALREGKDPLAAAQAEARAQPELVRTLELAAATDRDALAELAIGPGAGACWTTLAIALCALELGDY